MSDASMTLEMLIKEGKAVMGLERVAEAEKKVEEGATAIGTGAKQAERELERFAQQTTKINATPVEKYRVQMERLDKAIKNGLISQETYTRAVQRANREMAGIPQHSGNLETMAGKWFSAAGAVHFATAAITDFEQKATAARLRMREMADLRIELGQVGGPELQTKARELTKHGLTEREATEFAITAQNFGFAGDMEYFAKNKAAIGDLRSVAEIVGKGPELLGKQITPRESIAMTFAAANPSQLTPAQMAPIVARFAQSAQVQGTSPDEVYAWASVMPQKLPSAATASEWFGTFQTHLSTSDDPRLQGKGTIKAIEALRDMPKADRDKWMGKRSERIALYQTAVAALDEVKVRMGEIESARKSVGGPGDLLEATRRKNLANPLIASALKDTASEEHRLKAEEARSGVAMADTNVAKNQLLAELHTKKANAFSIWGAQGSMWFSQNVLGQTDPRRTLTAGAGMAYGLFGPQIDIEKLPAFKEAAASAATAQEAAAAAKEQREAAADMKEAARALMEAAAARPTRSLQAEFAMPIW